MQSLKSSFAGTRDVFTKAQTAQAPKRCQLQVRIPGAAGPGGWQGAGGARGAPRPCRQALGAGRQVLRGCRARPARAAQVQAAGLKELKSRIGSVTNTKKITEAMKLVAAAKVRRAQEAVVNGRPFSENLIKVRPRRGGPGGAWGRHDPAMHGRAWARRARSRSWRGGARRQAHSSPRLGARPRTVARCLLASFQPLVPP